MKPRKSGLSKWFKEKWVDISRPKKGGGYKSCGRKMQKEKGILNVYQPQKQPV